MTTPSPQAAIRTPRDSRRWLDAGTALFLGLADAVANDDAYDGPTLLPSWDRRHLIAHVAANADALINLAAWAATGEPSPMYASPADRADGIRARASLAPRQLNAKLHRATADLTGALDNLTEEHWRTEVRTAQGRVVPATEILWLRAREVMVHAVDLDLGTGFADLPDDFLHALAVDVINKRGSVLEVAPMPPLDEWVAYLTGRPHHVLDSHGRPVPDLPPWL